MTSKANKVPLFCHRFDRKIIKRYGKTNTISFERTSGRQKGTMGVEKKKKKRGWEKRERNGAENVYAYLQSRLSSLGSRFEGASLHSADHKANIQREGDRREGRVDIVRGVYTLCFGPFWREPVSLRACILWTRQPPVHAREYNETKRNETKRRFVYGVVFMEWPRVGVRSGRLFMDELYSESVGHRRRRLQISRLTFDRVSRRAHECALSIYREIKFSPISFNCTLTELLLSGCLNWILFHQLL